MNPVISIALPVFAVIGVGAAAGRFGWMKGADAQILNAFVFRFAMPAALFSLTASTAPPGPADFAITISYAVAATVVMVASYFLSKQLFHLSNKEAGGHAFTSTLGNAVFLGLPIALSVEGWGRPFVMLMLIEGVFIIAIGMALLSQGGGAPGASRLKSTAMLFAKPFGNPLVAAPVAGFIYSASGLPLPEAVASFFNLLGRAAGPTALFSLGLFLATNKFPAVGAIAGRVSGIAIAKLAVLPAIAISLAIALGVRDPHQLGALSLFTVVPSGIIAFVTASQFKTYVMEAAAAVSITTLISLVSISIVLTLFL